MRDLTLNEVEQVSGGTNVLAALADVVISAAGGLLGAGAGLVLGNALKGATVGSFLQGTLTATAVETSGVAGTVMATTIPPVLFVAGGAVVGVAVVGHYMLS